MKITKELKILTQELDGEIGSGAGNWIKSLVKPVAIVTGKTDCASCEVGRVAFNAFFRLRKKYGFRRAVEMLKQVRRTGMDEPERAAELLRQYLTLPEPLHVPVRRLFLKIACATGVAAALGKIGVALGATYPGWGCQCYNNVDPWECKNSTHFAMLINVVPPSTNNACGAAHSLIRVPSGIGNLISWLDCCIAHDLRYSDCWMFGMGLAQYKANVDNELYNCIKSKCQAFWWSWGMNKYCEDYASSYWAAVNSSQGDEAFRISLNESCACAPCGPPPASGGNPSQVLRICRAWGGWSDPTQVGPPWSPPVPSFEPPDGGF